MPKSQEALSLFTARFEETLDQWAPHLPAHLRAAFRADLRRFADLHEQTLKTIEGIWERRERAYAIDESTGLATRRPFHDHLTGLLHPRNADAPPVVGVLFVDIDDLKRINDTYGHQAGDRAIAAVGAILREGLRVERGSDLLVRADWAEPHAVGRRGGDEFTAALPLAAAGDIDAIALRLKRRADDRRIQQAHGYAGEVDLSVSVGAVAYEVSPVEGVAPNALASELLSTADALMYRSKHDGGVYVARARYTDRLDVADERRLADCGARRAGSV